MTHPVGLVVFGIFVALIWLSVVYYDRIARWRTPWDRWARPSPRLDGVMKVAVIGLAIVMTLVYVLALAVAVTG
jgi:TRAP-type C4-dicarboxylate transport system permease small subunit